MIPFLNAILLNAAPLNAIINVNEIFNKSLVAGDIFMPEKHLKQSEFTYSACGLFTKNKKKELKHLKKQEIQNILIEMN